ncbi:type II toxin-antitoxin system RelE/ParE family toxin [Mesorhizobium sp. M1027]|uniref:type II toxin-antitoxin system RelE/ParE family toxin n=1 Tax=Mesorhizobium sp. M1027 TaxID=2957050 RepID=UPI00333D5C4F
MRRFGSWISCKGGEICCPAPLLRCAREDIAPGIRHLIVGEYLTLYRVVEEAIEIVRVLHGRRKIDAGSATDCI